jgi:hypothetical protein
MRSIIYLLATLAAIFSAGCPLSEDPIPPLVSTAQSKETIEDRIARTLEGNRVHRQLSTQTHGAWQILHGVLAYGDQFSMLTPTGEKPALPSLLAGEPIDGFEPEQGDAFGEPARRGLRMAVQPTTKVGQGHRDQWLAYLAQCGLPFETELRSGDHVYTLDDWLLQAQYDVPLNLELEFSWTLIALAAFRPSDHQWTARDGEQYSTALLLESELQQDLPLSACGGTHRLIGIAVSVRKRRAEGKPMSGVWADAERVLAEAIKSARENQNPDGSYSADYLHRPGWTRDLGETLGTTGHVLEFLAFAASDETLREPWVERSAVRLCQVLEQCTDVDLECGGLYHALHGLQEYRHRRLTTVAGTASRSSLASAP